MENRPVNKTWHGHAQNPDDSSPYNLNSVLLLDDNQNLAEIKDLLHDKPTTTRIRSPSFQIHSLGRQPQVLHGSVQTEADTLGALRQTWSPGTRSMSFSLEESQLGQSLLSDVVPPTQSDPTYTSENERRCLLAMIFFILFTRYVIATFLSAFFPQVTTQQGISGTWEGIIFAAYPIGMAITSVLAPTSILKWGTRTSVMIGLFTCGISTAMFGLVPDFVNFIGNSDVRVLQYLYTGAYFLNGFFGGLADTGVLILVSSKFKDDIGVVFATIGTVCGVGCMVGPLVGATFYACTNNAVWKFRLPFMLTGIVPILLCMLCPFTLPQVYTAEDADDAKDINGTDVMNSTNDTNNGGSDEESRSSTRQKQSRKGCSHALRVLSTPAVALSVCAIALSGTIVATLDPTLAFRLSTCKHNCTADGSAAHNVSSFPAWVDGHPAPFDLTEAEVAFFFTYSSITYVAVSIPIGWIVDRYQSNARVFKLIQAFGFFLLSLTFALLGPLRLPSAFGGVTVEHSMNSMYCAAIALILKGLGSATNNAAYPDMVIGIDENDDVLSAIMSGAWNAAYSIGWAFGPLLGGALYEAVQFDGFATIISAVSLLYALILLFAVSCCKDNRERDAP